MDMSLDVAAVWCPRDSCVQSKCNVPSAAVLDWPSVQPNFNTCPQSPANMHAADCAHGQAGDCRLHIGRRCSHLFLSRGICWVSLKILDGFWLLVCCCQIRGLHFLLFSNLALRRSQSKQTTQLGISHTLAARDCATRPPRGKKLDDSGKAGACGKDSDGPCHDLQGDGLTGEVPSQKDKSTTSPSATVQRAIKPLLRPRHRDTVVAQNAV